MKNAYSMHQGIPAAAADVDARSAFIARTYAHLAVAIFAFTFIEIYFFNTGWAERILQVVANTSWLVVLGGFMVVGWIASRLAYTAKSRAAQYAALAGFVLAEAIIFVPLLYVAQQYAPGAITSAAAVTLAGFTGLTALVFITRKDFSFLRGLLGWGFIIALVLIGASIIFGFHLGTFFSVAMVALAGGAILYDTSNVLRRYPVDRHVSAALQLFASVALMFWYVLRIFIGSRD